MKTLVVSLLAVLVNVSAMARPYIVIGWNDLGMHCSNKDFSTLAVLPPYNVVHAQIIHVGDATNLPHVETTGFRITYEIPGNTYSVGKTNFWDYEDKLFGINLPANIGLTGVGLSGEMTASENLFTVAGIPITPFTDADLVHEDAFQLGLLKAYDQYNTLQSFTSPVIPVSNEINCLRAGCHSSEQAILDQHDAEGGFDPANKPILCASCHGSNALGTPLQPGIPALSEAIHLHHGERTNDCYACHPGPTVQCLRDVMKNKHGFTCQTCHGSVGNVGLTIENGRNPWLQEPSCGAVTCHGPTYAEEPGKLFRMSRGHGGLFCSACHGEPHAILPSGNQRDNVQSIALQGHTGTLDKCQVCHGVAPSGAGPHGISAAGCCIGKVGNADGDPFQMVDISDLQVYIDYLFFAGISSTCFEEFDCMRDGRVDISDLQGLIDYLFFGGALVACP